MQLCTGLNSLDIPRTRMKEQRNPQLGSSSQPTHHRTTKDRVETPQGSSGPTFLGKSTIQTRWSSTMSKIITKMSSVGIHHFPEILFQWLTALTEIIFPLVSNWSNFYPSPLIFSVWLPIKSESPSLQPPFKYFETPRRP